MKKTKLFLSACLLLSTATMFGQVNFDFNTQEEIDLWTADQGTLALSNNNYLQLTVNGSFWSIAKYEPEGGIEWDFDAYPICAIKLQKKFGDLFLKMSPVEGDDFKLQAGSSAGDVNVLKVNGTDEMIHIFLFDDFNAANDNAFVGKKTFKNIQFANEYVSNGQVLEFDWIKSFTSAEEALAFIMPIVEGGSSAIKTEKANPVKVVAQNNAIEVLNLPEGAQVQLLNIQGQLIASTTQNTIDNLASGLYIVVVDGQSQKVLVK